MECSSAMDSVDAAYKICKFSNQLKMQQQQIEDLKKELTTIEDSFLNHSSFFPFFFFLLFFCNEHPPPPPFLFDRRLCPSLELFDIKWKDVYFGHQELEEDLQLRELVTIVNRKRLIMWTKENQISA